MSPAELAALHAKAFTHERSWSEDEFHALLNDPLIQLITEPHGFALARTVAGETELLTLAVDPAFQRQGKGRRLTEGWIISARSQADVAFLEVASDNSGACALYHELGFVDVGQRKAYYQRENMASADAILMQRSLTCDHSADSTSPPLESG